MDGMLFCWLKRNLFRSILENVFVDEAHDDGVYLYEGVVFVKGEMLVLWSVKFIFRFPALYNLVFVLKP